MTTPNAPGKSETVSDFSTIEDALYTLRGAVERHTEGRLAAIEAAIDGGHALNALRQRAQHGDWARWVHDVGLTERTAHNWRRLADTGLSAQEVLDQGGIRAVLQTLSAPRNGNETNGHAQTLGRLEIIGIAEANADVLLSAVGQHIEAEHQRFEELKERFAQGDRSPELLKSLRLFTANYRRRHQRFVKDYEAQATAI